MRALITQREEYDSYGAGRDVLEADYTRFFEKNGIQLCPVSNFSIGLNEFSIKDVYDIVILTGGGSLWPDCYDCKRHDILQKNRDRIERELVAYALNNKIPILGICRGMQLLNALYGGKISMLDCVKKSRPICRDHPILMVDTGEVIEVNNYHNDGILEGNLAAEFRVIALDVENRVVEGFTSSEHKILGLQWHPERNFLSDVAREKTEEIIMHFINNNYRK